jgi:hypothetical protein
MATSYGGAAARGIETGFNLGMRADAAAEEKRARGIQEQRQREADARSQEDLNLRRSADARAERRLADAESRDVRSRAITGLEGRRKELLEAGSTAQASGAPVPSGLAEEYATVASRLAQFRQQALDDASRLATGQTSLETMTPAQMYRAVTVGTGMRMEDLAGMPKHAADLQAGMETNNRGLTLQAVNGLLGPQLRQGVGQPSPYGGTITRKEIIGLDPARDGAGVDHPNRVIPRIRVYVQRPGDPGEKYYDAPMTKNRSTDPDDRVVAIDITKALDWVGNLGVLSSALQRPGMQEKLAQGEQEVGPEVKKYFDEFYSLSKPKKQQQQVTRERVDLGDRVVEREVDQTGKVISEKEMKKGAVPRQATSGTGAATYQAKLAEINRQEEEGEITPEQAKIDRRALTAGIKPDTKGGGPGAGLSDRYDTDKKYAGDVDYWAKLIAAGGELPPRFAQSGAGKEMFQDIIQKVPDFGGGDPRKQMANRAEYGGAKAGSRTVGQRSANFELAKSEAYTMADLVTESSGRFGRTNFPLVNKALVSWEKNTGDVNVRQFGAAINSFINAYARAVAPIGSPAQKEKEHAREMLNDADSHDQVVGIIAQLKQEMEAAGKAPEIVREKQREAVAKSAPEIDKPQRGLNVGPPAPTTPPPGARIIVNRQTGERMMLQNGKWVPLQ